MSVNLKELFTVVPSKSYADPALTVANIGKVWSSICSFVQETLLSRKATNIADLGLFTFTQERNKLLPTFILASNFLRAYNIKQTQKPPAIAGNVPVVQINHTRIATESGLSRDQTTSALKSVVRCVGEAVKSGTRVALDFQFAKVLLASDTISSKFDPSFLNQLTMMSPKPTEKQHTSTPKRSPASTGKLAAITLDIKPASTEFVHAPNILSLHTEPNRPETPVFKYRSARPRIEEPKPKPASTPKEDLCDLCVNRDIQLELTKTRKDQERELERKLAESAFLESKKMTSVEDQKLAEQRRKRMEIDEFNRSLTKPKSLVTSIPGAETMKEEKDFYGHVMKDDSNIRPDNSKDYQSSLLSQMEEKKKMLEKEKQLNKQIELDLLNESLSEHKKHLQNSIDEKRKKQQENREYLLDQMATKQVPLTQLGVSEVQFMSHRLLSTAERKVKQKTDAKSRMTEQIEVIQDKQKQKEIEKEEERRYAELLKQQNEQERKREQELIAAKKNKTREELSKSLTDQIEESLKAKELEKSLHREGVPYLPIGVRPEDHHKHCKRCGKDIVPPVRYGRGGTKVTKT